VTSGELEAAVRAAAHPPPLPGTPSIDGSYRALVASLPGRLQATARVLPWRLGLTAREDGGWDEFVALHPNRELPVYAAEAPAGEGGLRLDPDGLGRFVSAHHAGGFAWLLRDRLADGQVTADEELLELVRRYGAHWRAALTGATGDGPLVDELSEDAIVRWRCATALERRAWAPGELTPEAWATGVRDKLAWIGVPARALLISGSDGEAEARSRERAFRCAHDLFLLALQAIDDVIDRDEDRRLRGTDGPTSLGCSPGALLRVAPKLAGLGAAVADAAGFSWFGSWLGTFTHAIRCWRLEGDAVEDELGAIGIAGQIEEVVLDGGGPMVQAAARATAPPPA
jgi:hypothetical protein